MTTYKPGTYIALFIGAHFAHHLLTALVAPILPFIRDSFSLSYAQAGGVVSAFTLSYGIAQLPAGWLADRLGRRYLITVGISGVALAGAVAGLTTSYIGLILALVVMGIAGGGYHPSAAPLIMASVPPQRTGRALGLHLIGGSASHFATPLLGATLAVVFGWRGAFLGISVPVFIFGLAFFLTLRGRGEQRWQLSDEEPRNPAQPTQKPMPPVDQRTSRRRTLFRITVFLVLTSAVGAAIGSLTAFIPLYLVDGFGLSEGWAAAALSAFFLTGVVAAPVGGALSDRFGPVPILVVLSIAVGPLLIAVGFAPWLPVFMGFLLGLGVAAFIRMPVSEAYLSADVPEHMRSTVLGVYFFAGMEASGVITPIVGALIDSRGFIPAFVSLGAVLTAVAVVSSLMLLRIHRSSN